MLDSYRELIDELLGAPSAIRGMMTDSTATPETMLLVAEIRDRDVVVLERLNTIMRATDPRFGVIAPGVPEIPESLEALLEQADTARGDLVSLLMNLTLKDWERTASHDVDGEISLSEEVERHVDFDEAHLARLRAALG